MEILMIICIINKEQLRLASLGLQNESEFHCDARSTTERAIRSVRLV
jgi:hypothetical protein